jgi:hypothetical protein
MRFVIDETSWNFNGLTQKDFLEKIESFLDLIDFHIEQGHAICYSEDLFYCQVYVNLSFYELYDPQGALFLPPPVQERVAIIFSQLQKWEDFEDWPASFDVQISPNRALESAPSIAWAHHRNQANVIESVACLVFSEGRSSGSFDVEVAQINRVIWFVSDQANSVNFFRWIILNGTASPAQMERFAVVAFPELDFASNVFNGIKTMSKPYGAILPDLVHHLSVFSDHGKKIFSGPYIDAPSQFGAHGLNVSDENGNTKSNSEAKKDHTRSFNGKDIQFWWHSKIEPDRDRIHFDPSPLSAEKKIIVGIFCRHLIT